MAFTLQRTTNGNILRNNDGGVAGDCCCGDDPPVNPCMSGPPVDITMSWTDGDTTKSWLGLSWTNGETKTLCPTYSCTTGATSPEESAKLSGGPSASAWNVRATVTANHAQRVITLNGPPLGTGTPSTFNFFAIYSRTSFGTLSTISPFNVSTFSPTNASSFGFTGYNAPPIPDEMFGFITLPGGVTLTWSRSGYESFWNTCGH